MVEPPNATSDTTAVRVALWRALHGQIDAQPHVLDDQLGLAMVAPDDDWRARPDMHPARTGRSRASIVARARFIEDLVEERARQEVLQYVLLGAGLDSFAQRRPELESQLRVFEVDQPGTLAWKRARLHDLGFGVPEWHRLVPANFEASESWWKPLVRAGFDPLRPAVVASLGVAMYLTREAIAATLRQVAMLAAGSTFAMSFMLPLELVEPEEVPGIQGAARGASAAGTPFRSLFAPKEMIALVRQAGFRDVTHVSAAQLTARYFSGRADGLRPSSAEELVVATT